MIRLQLEGMSSKSDEELNEADQRLINALVQSGFRRIQMLNLGQNPAWFKHSEAQSYMLDFIHQQAFLKKLQLSENNFSSELTFNLFSALMQSMSLKTIEDLNLEGSCDFTNERAQELLALFIDAATQLSECNISLQVAYSYRAYLKVAEKGCKEGLIQIYSDIEIGKGGKGALQLTTQRTKDVKFKQ